MNNIINMCQFGTDGLMEKLEINKYEQLTTSKITVKAKAINIYTGVKRC